MSFLDSLLGGIKAIFYSGTLQPQEPAINFTGAGVSVADDPSNGYTTVTISGGAAGDRTYVTPQQYGAVGNGSTDDSGAFITMIAASADKDILISDGNFKLSNNVTFASTNTVYFGNEAFLSIDSGKTVTFNGPIVNAPPNAIFSGSGVVAFAAGSQPFVYPDWWGSGTGAVQAAVNAASAVGITVRLLAPKQYALGSGSVGLTITNPNTSVVGDGEVGGPDTSVTGAELYYTGTGKAVQLGVSVDTASLTFTKNIRLENFAVKTNDSCPIGVHAWALYNSVFEHICIFGPSTTSNVCLQANQCLDFTIIQCEIQGSGRAGTAPISNYADGIIVRPIAGSPTTTTRIDFTYIHYCHWGLTVDTSFVSMIGSIFESSKGSFNTLNNARLDMTNMHIENVGDDALTYPGGGYVAGGTEVSLDKSTIVMYSGVTEAFIVAGNGILNLGENRYSGVSANCRLFKGAHTTDTAQITIREKPVFVGTTWSINDGGQPSWRAAPVLAQNIVKHTFNLSNVTASLSGVIVPPDNGFSGNVYRVSGPSYLLGLYAYYSSAISAGHMQLQAKLNGTVKIDTSTFNTQTVVINEPADGIAMVLDDQLEMFITTDGSFAPINGDVIVELYVGYLK